MTTRHALPILIAAILAAALPARAQTWKTLGRLSLPRAVYCAAELGNGQILVMGGYTPSGNDQAPTATCELIDLRKGSITRAASMKYARAAFVALYTFDSNIVVISGDMTGNQDVGDLTPSVEMYNRATRSWTLLGNLRRARYQHAAEFINDHEILVVGGRNADLSCTAESEIFDIITGRSRMAASFPFPTNLARMAHDQDGNVVLLGYRTGGANSGRDSIVYRYNVAQDRWEHLAGLAAPVMHPELLPLWDGRLVTLSGSRREDPLDFSYEVEIENGSDWSVLGRLNDERHWFGVAQWSPDSILVAGGFNDQNTVLQRSEWVNVATGQVSAGPSMTTARKYFSLVSVPLSWLEIGPASAEIVAISGYSDTEPFASTVEVLAPECFASASPDIRVPSGGSAQLWAIGGPGAHYSWLPPIGLSCTDCPDPIATPTATTAYVVTVTNASGCVAMDTVFVEVMIPASATEGSSASDATAGFDASADPSIVAFHLAHPAHIRLEAFDRIGRLVGRLLDGELEAGEHEARWQNAALPSGVYYLRLGTGAASVGRAVTLVR